MDRRKLASTVQKETIQQTQIKIFPLTLFLLPRNMWIWGHSLAPDEISSQFSEFCKSTQSSLKVHLFKKKKRQQNSNPTHALVKTFSYLASVRNAGFCIVDYWFFARIGTWSIYLYISIIGSFCNSLFLFYAFKTTILGRALQASHRSTAQGLPGARKPWVRGHRDAAMHRRLILGDTYNYRLLLGPHPSCRLKEARVSTWNAIFKIGHWWKRSPRRMSMSSN